MIDILQTILDILWLVFRISVVTILILFVTGVVIGALDYIKEHKK